MAEEREYRRCECCGSLLPVNADGTLEAADMRLINELFNRIDALRQTQRDFIETHDMNGGKDQ